MVEEKESSDSTDAASKELDAQLVLVGDSGAIEEIAKEEQFDLSSVEIVHASEVVTMEDDPIRVIRAKKQSSYRKPILDNRAHYQKGNPCRHNGRNSFSKRKTPPLG